MNDFGPVTIPPQNFAVSSIWTLRVVEWEPGLSLLSAEIDRLDDDVTRAWERWWELFRAPDVWTDAGMRRAMCAARLEYQDALFELAEACAAVNSARPR